MEREEWRERKKGSLNFDENAKEKEQNSCFDCRRINDSIQQDIGPFRSRTIEFTMNPSRQKLIILSLIFLVYSIREIDSFGQHGDLTSIVHHRSVGRRHHNDQQHFQNFVTKSSILPPLFSTTQYREHPKKEWRQNNGNNNNGKPKNFQGGYQNKFGMLNKKITSQDSAQDILRVLALTKGSLSSIAGGEKLSTVNFSTSIHRIARHVTQYTSKNKPGNDRADILKDPRFALLMCSMAEALLDGAEKTDFKFRSSMHQGQSEYGRNYFGARELANIAWAIAKINIAPPDSTMPVDIGNAESLLREKSEFLRSAIFDVAKQRATSGSSSSSSPSLWIPALSELCGLIVDTVCAKALTLDPKKFQQQELANLMWALATVRRPNQDVFEFVITSIIASAKNRKEQMRCNSSNPNYKAKDKNMKDDVVPQEWSIPLWVLAKTGTDMGHEEELLPFVNDMMANEPGFLERFKPQELSNSVWAAATIISKRAQTAQGAASDAALGILRHTSREMIRRQGEGYKTQELTNHAWAMATLGFGISANQAAKSAESCQLTHSYTYLRSDDPEGDQALMEETLDVVIYKAEQNLRRFTSQELNNLCWTMARLDRKDDKLLGMIGRELANPRKRVGSQDLSTSLWSMATLEYVNEDLYRSIVARFTDIGVDQFKPQEVSNTLWALATAGVAPKYISIFDDQLLSSKVLPSMEEAMSDPVTAIFGAGAAELSRRPNEFKTQEIKDLIWAFARVGMRHPKLFRMVAEHLVGKGDHPEVTGRGLNEFNTQGIANLAYSYARHTQLGGETMDKYKHSCRIPFTGGKLAYFTIVYLDVGEGLLRKLFAEIARADMEVHDNLNRCTAQDISNTLWAMGLLGLKHKRFLEAAERTLKQRMESYVAGNKSARNTISGQEMGNSLWAFATLDYRSSGMLGSVERYWSEMFGGDQTVANVARYITRQEMANIAWAAAVFGDYPKNLIELLYNGILGVSEGLDPEYMQETLYKDTGIQPTHFNSLLYLQIMMDLDLGVDRNPFSLPENFPLAWTSNPALMGQDFDSSSTSSSSSNSPSAASRDSNGIMELSTSAIQTRISNAFDRIDFGHVDEHVLTMKDLTDEFGIQMPSLPVDVLSLDIANIDSKIGVEVDGPGHWITDIDPTNNPNMLFSVGEWRQKKSREVGSIFEYTFDWNLNEQGFNGSTRLKHRLFKHIGWKIISIPFWEWFPVDDSSLEKGKRIEAQNGFCRSVLEGSSDSKNR